MSDAVPRHPDLPMLRQFRFLDDLDDDRLALLGKSLRVLRALKRKRLLARGDRADFSLLLLRGELNLTDAEGRRFHLAAGNELASGPVAPDLPRHYDVDCAGQVWYLEVDNRLLEALRTACTAKGSAVPGRYPVPGDDSLEALIRAVRTDLEADLLELPTLPEVALRIGKAMDDESADAQRIAAIVQSDAAMTTKLIKVANSAYYAAPRPAGTCAEAVIRLGFQATYKLVLSFALREVFVVGSGPVMGRMRALWRHSVHVSALCFALAGRVRGFDPEYALLCGLVHDIGLVPLLAYAKRFPVVANDQAILDRMAQEFRADVGGLVLDHWRFPSWLVTCPRYAEDWYRDSGPEPDYGDLLVIAHVLQAFSTGQSDGLPDLNAMPAFHKLQLGGFDPQNSLEILEPVRDRLAFIESTFGD
jgi:HD-like signal output (HDOD) protein